MLILMLALAAGVTTDFEAGRLAGSEWIAPSHLRVSVHGETDQDGRNRQPSWFYFRAAVKPGSELTVDIADLWGEYNYRKHNGQGLRNTLPVYSYDNRQWNHFETSDWIEDKSTIRVRFTPTSGVVWIARQAPYTTRHLDRLIRQIKPHKSVEMQVAGKTVEDRPMYLLTITDPAKPGRHKKVLWLMARQHAWESGTSWVAEGVLTFLLSNASEAARIREGCIVKMFPMADPDGVVRGGVRFNKHGYDLNRNWDTVDPVTMPEIASQRRAILAWKDAGNPIDLFLTLHNTESSEYISGPQDPGQRFWKVLTDTTTFYSPDGLRKSEQTTTPGMKGRMTVNQGLFHERKIPAFLMEQMVDRNPELGRPATIKDRLAFGSGLIQAMAATVGCGDR